MKAKHVVVAVVAVAVVVVVAMLAAFFLFASRGTRVENAVVAADTANLQQRIILS